MLVDAREIESGTVLRADVCVVGAGAAGIAIARELAGAPLDVLLLESGGFEPDAATTALNEGRVAGEPLDTTMELPLHALRLRYFGGTTNHWAGWSRPLQAIDFEHRPSMPLSGWPVGLDDLVPFYRRASDVLELGPFEYGWRWWNERHGIGVPVVDDPDLTTGVIHVTTVRSGTRHRDELVRAPRVRLCLWANAVDLVLAPDGSRLAGIEVATLTGRRVRAEARAYVLATGGIEVPRLLLASSRAIRPNGVGNGHDLVGRHFMEHLNLPCGSAALARTAQELGLYTIRDFPPIKTMGFLAPSAAAQRREQLLGIEVTLGIVPPEMVHMFPDAVGRGDGIAADQVARRLTLGGRPSLVSTVRVVAEQAPNPSSRVTLLSDRDALGVPRALLDWRPTAGDRESIVRSLQLIARVLGRSRAGRLQVATGEALGTHVLPGPAYVARGALDAALPPLDFAMRTGFHHMGTARMHDSPRSGVVDAQCRLHEVPNLYVAGSAVFPTGGASGPTFTIVALALRLADLLRRTVRA